ncbi:hypothetical protein ACS0TY_005156 [Phlomoides rotata]
MVGEAQTSNPNPYDPHNSSLQTRRRSCVVIPENFPVGTEVEVRTDEEGFKFVYFTAKVISPPALTKSQSPTKKVGRKKSAKKSDKETSICLEVEYHNLLASNKGRDRLREILDIPFVRPVPPVQEIDKGFEPGDVVDAYYKDGWWQGVVAEVVEDGGKFVVSFHDPPDLECALKNLRYHWDWVDGSWVRPYKENMSGLMFQVGREVEVSFDREESQDAWFPASIHEDLGNGFFRVEYMNKNGEAVKTTVDSLHVRPCPPLLKDTNFVLLEKVDAYFDYCWWSGVITKELENSRYIVFFKPMKQDREIYQSKLRPHMEWKEGKWFTSSQEASLQSLDDGVHEHHFSENASATVAAAPVKNSVNGKDTCDGKTLTSLTSTKDQVEQLTPDNQKMSHTNTSLKKRRRYLTDSGAIQSLPPKKPKEGNVAVTKPQDKTGEERIKEVLCGFVSPDSASNTDTSAMQTTEDHPAFDHSWEKKIQRKQRNDCSKQNSSGMITPTPCSMKNNKTNFKSQTLDIRGEVLGAAENYLEDVQNEHANEELEVPIIIGLPCFEAGSPGISGGRKSQGFKIKEVATIVNDQEPPLINSSILKDNMQPGTRESSERRKRGWPKRTPVESTQTPVSGKSQNGNVATFDLNKKDDLERSHEIEVIEMESMLSNQKTEVNKEKVADGLPYPKNKRVRTKKRTSPSVHKEKGMEESVELGENLLLKKKGRKMTAVQVLGEAQTSNPNPHDPHNSSLQTRRRSGVVIPENFPVGTEVEVRTDEEGFKFVYFTAKVISPPALTKSQSPTKKVGRKKSAKKSDKETSICLEVEYHNLLASNKGRDRLRETLDISFVRPVPPVQEIDKGFEPGDVVDAYYKDSWWQGVVAEVVEDGGKFVVSFHDPPDLECALKNLRYHWDWVDGSWVRPYKENMSGLMFEVGRKVEVSFDREDSQDAWFPASIHEDLGNGFFRVEYMNKNGEAVKTTVDSLHVRPCPPLLKDKNLVLLEKVDAYFDYCWWSGVITKELENSRYIVFFKPMKQDREIYQSKLRPHMEWKEGKWFTSSQRKQRNVRSKQNSSGMITPTPCSMKNNKTIFKSQTLDIRGEVLGAAENYLEDVQNEHANEELEVPIIIGLPCFEAGSPGISGGRKSQGFKIKEVATIVNDQEPPLINSSILKDNMQPGTRESSERRKRGRPKRTPVESTQTPASGKSQNGNVATFDLNKKDDSERSPEMEVIEMESMLSNQKTEVNKEKVADAPYPKNKRVRTMKRTSPSVHKEKGMKESVELGENLLLKKKGRKLTAVQVLDSLDASGGTTMVVERTIEVQGDVEVHNNTKFDNEPLSKWIVELNSPVLIDSSSPSPDGSPDQYQVNGEKQSDGVVIDEGSEKQLESGKQPSASGAKKSTVSSEPQSLPAVENTVGVVLDNNSGKQTESHKTVVFADKGFTGKSDAQGLPFVKTVSLWKTIESMEVFQKIPQNPHFQPLMQVEESSYREGLALGLMVTFASLVETTSKLQLTDTKSTVNDIIETVKRLDEHGFDVEVFKDHISEFLEVKDKEEKLVGEVNNLNNQIVQRSHENTRIEEEMQEINEQIRRLQEKYSAAESAKGHLSEEVASLKVLLEETEESIVNLRRNFKGAVF